MCDSMQSLTFLKYYFYCHNNIDINNNNNEFQTMYSTDNQLTFMGNNVLLQNFTHISGNSYPYYRKYFPFQIWFLHFFYSAHLLLRTHSHLGKFGYQYFSSLLFWFLPIAHCNFSRSLSIASLKLPHKLDFTYSSC